MDYTKEKNEAIAAGNRALIALKDAKNYLESARKWGVWDILGGGTFSSFIKHSKLSNARSAMDNARYCLMTFANELNDIKYNLNVDVCGFLTFLDFYDNFFADIIVQSRIRQALDNVNEAIRRVQKILLQLG